MGIMRQPHPAASCLCVEFIFFLTWCTLECRKVVIIMKGSKMNPYSVGLVAGGFLGGLHAVWALVVALKLAQPLLDWVFALHFLVNPYTVQPFEMGTAVLLVAVTGVFGYAAGWLFGALWNGLVKK